MIAQSKKPPLDPDLVLREYVYQTQAGGKRGAYNRTAVRVGRSDEYVRKLVRATEQTAKPVLGTAYEHAPGELKLAEDRALLARMLANNVIETPTDANVTLSPPRSNPLATARRLATGERETAPVVSAPIATVVIVTYGGAMGRASDDALPWLMALAALTATLCVLLTALAGSVVAVAWIPFPLVLWWSAGRLRRLQAS